MRFSTVLSFILALILAGIAVYGAQIWLAQERLQLANSLSEQVERAQVEEESRTIVVAAEPISFGERMVPSKVREIEWASPVLPEGSYAKTEDLILGDSEEVARFALTSIAVGEPILNSKVTEPGQRAKMSTALTPGMKAISIRVNDVLGVAGFVLPGDRVDILLTRGGAGGAFVDVLLQGVKVLAIDQIADDRKDQPSVVRTVTFEADTYQAQKLVLGANVGSLSLLLRNVASTEIQDFERVTIGDLTELDAAEDIVEANRAEAEAQASEEATEAEEDRLVNLETLLKNLSDGLSERIEGVEEKIEKEPVIVEKIVEKVVTPPVVLPRNSSVGVIRNGTRSEYKVKRNEDGDLVNENGELVNANGELIDENGDVIPGQNAEPVQESAAATSN